MFWFLNKKKKDKKALSKEDQRIDKIFKRYGNKMTMNQLKYRIDRLPLYSHEKEYIKAVLAKFEHPTSRYITKEEFLKALDEMKKNKRDLISEEEVERIKRYF